MTNNNWKTLRVPPEAYEEAKAQKEEAGRTWGEQVVAPVEPDDVDTDELVERLERIESAAREATSAAQSADRKLEELGR